MPTWNVGWLRAPIGGAKPPPQPIKVASPWREGGDGGGPTTPPTEYGQLFPSPAYPYPPAP